MRLQKKMGVSDAFIQKPRRQEEKEQKCYT
jgi:hypothetical protein